MLSDAATLEHVLIACQSASLSAPAPAVRRPTSRLRLASTWRRSNVMRTTDEHGSTRPGHRPTLVLARAQVQSKSRQPRGPWRKPRAALTARWTGCGARALRVEGATRCGPSAIRILRPLERPQVHSSAARASRAAPGERSAPRWLRAWRAALRARFARRARRAASRAQSESSDRSRVSGSMAARPAPAARPLAQTARRAGRAPGGARCAHRSGVLGSVAARLAPAARLLARKPRAALAARRAERATHAQREASAARARLSAIRIS